MTADTVLPQPFAALGLTGSEYDKIVATLGRRPTGRFRFAHGSDTPGAVPGPEPAVVGDGDVLSVDPHR